MQKVSAKHRALGQSIALLEARGNPHNDLPLTVSSVVAPLVSPLLGNGAGGDAQPSSSPSPQPAPVSPPGSDGGSGNSGGGNNGGNNGGGNSNGGGSGGGSNGGGNSGGNTPTPTTPPTTGGGTTVPPVSIGPSPSSPGSTPGNTPGSFGPNNANSGGSGASSSSLGGGGGGQTLPVNVASEPYATPSPSLDVFAPAASATGSSSSSQHSSGPDTDSVGTAASVPTISTAATVLSGKQLSGGAIAGITVVCLLFLFSLSLVVLRRRSIARRLELRRKWWDTSGRNFFLTNNGSTRSRAGSNGEVPASRLSARSSFATNFDRGLMFRADSPSRFSLGLVPDLPPMAEVRERNSVLISTGGAVARRGSMNSMLSNGSNPDAQYLTIPPGQNNLEPSTPMSVRPFSPSESFAFPKPPAPPSSAVDPFFTPDPQGFVSPQSSVTALVHLSTPPRAFMADVPPAPVSNSLHPQMSNPSIAHSPFIAVANPSVDPFADSAKSEIADVEVIRRPFSPSLEDELVVHQGDHIRILRIFDDGWAFVEKLAGIESERHERGLIPVDCFREADQALPIFLAEQRVSYGSDQLIATAL